MSFEARLRQDGETMDYTPSSAVAAGEVVPLGTFCGVATHPIAANALGALRVQGIFLVAAVTAETWVIGDKLYWDDSVNKATTTAGSNVFLGTASAAKTSSDTTGYCRLMDLSSSGAAGNESSGGAQLLHFQGAAATASGNTAVFTAPRKLRMTNAFFYQRGTTASDVELRNGASTTATRAVVSSGTTAEAFKQLELKLATVEVASGATVYVNLSTADATGVEVHIHAVPIA